jgi:branched-chain amino acid transport system permease protein
MRDINSGLLNLETTVGLTLAFGILVVAFAVNAFIASPGYLLNQLFFIAMFGFVATAWNIVSGFTGQVSLGHALFFGIGAYTSSVLWNDLAITPWLGALVGGFVAGFVGLIMGYATFRRGIGGHYFAVFTLGIVAAFHLVLLEISKLVLFGITFNIEAASGLTLNIPSGDGFVANLYALQFSNQIMYVAIMSVLLAALLLSTAILSRSRLGYWMRAIREDQDAAEALGVESFRIKMGALFVSAFFTAVGGTMFAQQQTYIHPNSVATAILSIEIAVFAIIGGIDYAYGPLVGTTVIYTLTTLLQSNVEILVGIVQTIPLLTLNQSWVSSGINSFVYGLVLILVIIFLGDGIAGSLTNWFVKRIQGQTGSGTGTTVSQRSD